jgi:SPP1 gp7 family putative phage head morphogenesis protein
MNFIDFQLQAYKATEREASTLLLSITDSYDSARKEIVRRLEQIYGRYLVTADPQDYYNIMIQYDRLNGLLKDVNDTYIKYSKMAGTVTSEAMSMSMSNTYYRQNYALSWVTPLDGVSLTFKKLDPRLIELSVFGTQEAWKNISKAVAEKYGRASLYAPAYGTLSDLLFNNRTRELLNLQRTITQAFIQGDSMKQVSKSITGLFETSKFNADRIAQTEMARTANLGNYANGQEAISQGVDLKKMWMASLDGRTRPEHASLDGVTIDYNDTFKIDGDEALMPLQFSEAGNNINCRCTVIDIVGDYKPTIRRGREPIMKDGKAIGEGDNTIFSYKNFETWAKENGLKRNKYGQLY